LGLAHEALCFGNKFLVSGIIGTTLPPRNYTSFNLKLIQFLSSIGFSQEKKI